MSLYGMSPDVEYHPRNVDTFPNMAKHIHKFVIPVESTSKPIMETVATLTSIYYKEVGRTITVTKLMCECGKVKEI